MGHIWGVGVPLSHWSPKISHRGHVFLPAHSEVELNICKAPGVCALGDLGGTGYWGLCFLAPWLSPLHNFSHKHWQRQRRVCGTTSSQQILHKTHLGSTTEQPSNYHFLCTCACRGHFYHFAMLHWPTDFFFQLCTFFFTTIIFIFIITSTPLMAFRYEQSMNLRARLCRDKNIVVYILCQSII